MRTPVLAALLVAVCLHSVAFAVPHEIPAQGRLLKASGAPVDTGSYIFIFRIMNAATGGSELWPGSGGEFQTLPVQAGGLWQARIGSVLPIPDALFRDSLLWLEISVNDGNTTDVLSRLRLGTEPYAFGSSFSATSDEAVRLGGLLPSDFALALHTHTPADIAPQGAGSGLDADLVDGMQASAFALATHQHTPSAISPQGSGSGLDADLLDGKHADEFAPVTHLHSPSAISPQGSGSGLDADLLDGKQATEFAGAVHMHSPSDIAPQGPGSGLNADLLDGKDAAAFADTLHTHPGLWSTNGSNFYFNGGRVGIGTTSPASPLHVRSGASTGVVPNSSTVGFFESDNIGYLSLITPDFAERGILFGEPSSNMAGGIIYNNALTPDGLQFRTAFNVRGMALESSGRLAIGTFTGAGALQVVGLASNSTVALPSNSIGPDEILAEPGLATNFNGAAVTLASTVMQDIVTVQIDLPLSGYVFLNGKCNGLTHGTTGRNEGSVQIVETTTGSVVSPYSATFGLTGYSDGSLASSFPVYVERVFFKAAGSYTFHMEAAQNSANGVGSVTRVSQSILTATYFPTSYGDAMTVASESERGAFNEARRLSSEEGDGYRVDLRELELKAARLQNAAQEAELAVQRARAQERPPSGNPQ